MMVIREDFSYWLVVEVILHLLLFQSQKHSMQLTVSSSSITGFACKTK